VNPSDEPDLEKPGRKFLNVLPATNATIIFYGSGVSQKNILI